MEDGTSELNFKQADKEKEHEMSKETEIFRRNSVFFLLAKTTPKKNKVGRLTLMNFQTQ